MREAETFESEVVAELQPFMCLQVLEIGHGRRIKVMSETFGEGWISCKTRLNEALVAACNLDFVLEDFEAGGEHEVKSVVTMRQEESLDSPVICDLTPGTRVKILEMGTEINRRAKIQVQDNLHGWISVCTKRGEILVGKVDMMPLRTDKAKELLEAACANDVHRIQSLLQRPGSSFQRRASLNCSDIRGKTALMYAAAFGNTAVVAHLLLNYREVDVNVVDDTRKGALHHACKRVKARRSEECDDVHSQIVGMLVDADAQLEARDHNGCTAIMFAIATGSEVVVQRLLTARAQVNVADYEGHTVLDYAVHLGQDRIANVLRAHNAKEPSENVEATSECIRVAARFRPIDEIEDKQGVDQVVVRFGSDGKSCSMVTGWSSGSGNADFVYDNVYQPGVSQEDVYMGTAQPIVEGVIQGFNGAIIAYGQTGSGKTHTMLGPDGAQAFLGDAEIDISQAGVIPRALQELLDNAGKSSKVQLRASYLEIYQEQIFDLLAPCQGGTSVMDKAKRLHLPEVTDLPMNSLRDAMEVMRKGNTNRHMAATSMNRHSSRSHAIFIVTMRNMTDDAHHKFSQLFLVDLAGSERILKTGVVGQQLEEAKKINTSLLALGKVIEALSNKQKHIPYRDSKLTRLLKNSLGGNARAAVIISASLHAHNAAETLSALRFGVRASKIQNTASVNVEEGLADLKRKLSKLQVDVDELRGFRDELKKQIRAFQATQATEMNQPLGQAVCVDTGSTEVTLQVRAAKRLYIWGMLPSLVCPLTRGIMRDPVCASDGLSYERTAIEQHLGAPSRALPLSPVCGEPLTSRILMPNLLLQQLIHRHLSDLFPFGEQLPQTALLQSWHVRKILMYLDVASIACCEAVWTYFMAASRSPS